MRLTSFLSSIVVGIVLAGNLYGDGFLSAGDSFDDGVRNRLLWRPESGTTGRFLETGGHLFLDAITPPPPEIHFARWNWKTTYVLINADILEIEALVSMPVFVGMPPGVACDLGFGLKEASSSSYLSFYTRESPSGRGLIVETAKDDNFPIVAGNALPVSANRFYVKIRYVNGTGKASFWCRPVYGTVWTKIGSTINLRSRWGRTGVSSLTVQPFVMGYTYNFSLTPSQNVFLDNFRCSLWLNDPP